MDSEVADPVGDVFHELLAHLPDELKHALLIQALETCGPECLVGLDAARDAILLAAAKQEPALLRTVTQYLEGVTEHDGDDDGEFGAAAGGDGGGEDGIVAGDVYDEDDDGDDDSEGAADDDDDDDEFVDGDAADDAFPQPHGIGDVGPHEDGTSAAAAGGRKRPRGPASALGRAGAECASDADVPEAADGGVSGGAVT